MSIPKSLLRRPLPLLVFALWALWALSAPVDASAAAPAVGDAVPDLSLSTLDDSLRVLSERDGPTVLVFFRSTW